jgi:hypothetical protein
MFKFLLSPDPAEGTPPVDPPNPPVANPAPPPAATTVVTGTKNENEVRMEGELQQLRDEKRGLETKNAELQDQVHELTKEPKSEWKSRLFKL